MPSENYHNGLRRIQKLRNLSDLKYFYQARGQGASYAWEAIQALEQRNEATLKKLPMWYTYVFPYPLPQKSDPPSRYFIWNISMVTAVDLLLDSEFGSHIGYALSVLRYSDPSFIKKLFVADEELKTWINEWLEDFRLVFRISGVENNAEALDYCRYTLRELIGQGLVPVREYDDDSLDDAFKELKRYKWKVSFPNGQSPFCKGIGQAAMRLWAEILQFLQDNKRFPPDFLKANSWIELVFPCPQTTTDCRKLLRDHSQAFRLGYATMVLKETITNLESVPEVDRDNDSGGNKPEEPYEHLLKQVGKIKAIQDCMTAAYFMLMPGFNTATDTDDTDASKICKDVLAIFYEGQPSEAYKLIGNMMIELSVDLLKAVLDDRALWERWFHRGMLVAKDLDRIDSKSKDKGVLWESRDLGEWKARSTGMAWRDLREEA